MRQIFPASGPMPPPISIARRLIDAWLSA